MAPGHEGTEPPDATVGECCNLGYSKCPRIPQEREADAVHFCVASDREGIVSLHWVFVKDHGAAGFGRLHFERSSGNWKDQHPSAIVQRMAQCYLDSYLARTGELRRVGASQ